MTNEILTKEFLEAILPAQGNVCLGNVTQPKPNQINGHRPPFRHLFMARDNDSRLEDSINRAIGDDKRHWYFAVATYGPQSEGRKAKNARYIRCLVIDVDLKDDNPKHFSAVAEVLPALKNLQQQVPSLPRPWLVHSGHGVHVYYAVDVDMSPAIWRPLAFLFANVVAKIEPKLIVDRKRTIDMASVLRIPGTLNIKRKPYKEVKLLNPPHRRGGVGDLKDVQSGLASAAAKLGATGSMAVMPQGFLADSKPAYMQGVDMQHSYGLGMDDIKDWQLEDLNPRPIIEGCKQMRELFQIKGNVDEPYWLDMLRVINTMAKADELAVEFSSGHPTFSKAETLQKMRHVRKSFESPSAGCDAFEAHNPGGCRGCKFKGQVWTPSQLAVVAEQKEAIEEATEQALESAAKGEKVDGGYLAQPSYAKPNRTSVRQGPRTFLPVFSGGENGTEEDKALIAGVLNLKGSSVRREMTVVDGREELEDKERNVHMEVEMAAGDSRVVVAAGELSSQQANAATKTLRNVGLPIRLQGKGHGPAMSRYLNDLNEIAAHHVTYLYPIKGWIRSGALGNWSFIAGRRRYHPDGSVEECVSTAEHYGLSAESEGFMEKCMTGKPEGRLSLWQEGMKVYGGRHYAAQMMLLSGLGNLLLPLASDNKGGILLALTGKSGKGKTSLLRCLASFMGDHRRYILPGESTKNALGMLMQQSNCMLMPVDDTVDKDSTTLTTMLNMVTGGSEKARMNWTEGSGSVKLGEGFNASVLLTSNYSMKDLIGRGGAFRDQLESEAARTRLLELSAEAIIVDGIGRSEWKRSNYLISNHYGHAAHYFLKFVVENQRLVKNALDRQEDWAEEQLMQYVRENKRGTLRFWVQYLALVNVTAYIVCHKLGLLPWDHIKIRDRALKLVIDTLEENVHTDKGVVAELLQILTTEPNMNLNAEPTINITRHDITNESNWPDWRVSSWLGRRKYSTWHEDGMLGPGKDYSFRWRMDSYYHEEDDGEETVEYLAYLTISELRELVMEYGQRLGVSGVADLQRSLTDAGCIVNGLIDGRLDTRHGVSKRINQTRASDKDNPIRCAEIRFPPIIKSVED